MKSVAEIAAEVFAALPDRPRSEPVRPPACPDCGGTTWQIVQDGYNAAARPCHCAAEIKARRIEERAHIPEEFGAARLDNFALPHPNNPVGLRSLGTALNVVGRWSENYPNCNPPGLLLIGPPGGGKTHLAVGALRSAMKRGYEGVFWNYGRLLACIRKSYGPNADSSLRSIYNSLREIPILLLDGLGDSSKTAWVEDTINSIFVHRLNNQKALIATTELRDPDIEQITDCERYTSDAQRPMLADRIGRHSRSCLFEMCTLVSVIPGAGSHAGVRVWSK
jgi:DNA replication protein DnaC